MVKNAKPKMCPYFKNPHCALVKGAECEAEPSTPETCVDFVHRERLYGISKTNVCPECGEALTPVDRSKGKRFECENESCLVIEVRIGRDGEKRVISQPKYIHATA